MATLLTVSVFVCLSLCVAVHSAQKYPVTFNQALHLSLSPEVFNGTWISSDEYLYAKDEDFSQVKFNVKTGKVTTLVGRETIETFKVTDVSVSADGRWVAVEHDEQSVYRHSRTSLYTLIKLDDGSQYDLADRRRIQLLVWAPVGSGLAFVMENNVYYQNEADRVGGLYHQITNTSKEVYNGVADWVYEEEVLGDSKALWFSPKGTKMVFATLNDTNVRNVTFWKYGDPGQLASQYVQEVVIKYPKVGTRNPVAYLNYVDLSSDLLKPEIIMSPVKLVTSDNILGPVSWVNESYFSATWMERLQTRAYTLVCTPGDCQEVYYYKEENGWLDIVEPVWVNSSAFLTILPQDQGGNSGNYRQLSLVEKGQDTSLTSGLDVVISIDCYDRDNNVVYYTSTVDGNSAQRLVYKMDLNNPKEKERYGSKDCAYEVASFSKSCAYAVLTCKGPSVPQFNIYDRNGMLVLPLSNNSELSEVLKKIELPSKLNLNVDLPGNFTARVRLLLPPHLDPVGATKYPLLFYVYSGPDFNRISDEWSVPGWDDYLVTSRQVVVAYLDGRGSGLRGDKLKFAIYHKLGGPEIEDILIIGQYLQEHFPFVDPDRTAIWGWSYGGFATAMTLAKDNMTFHCGISVAPVTNWIYYDTVYTERYMGLPTNESNLEGYLASDVSARVENFRNKLFYLIHGNADDNVHYQQSMMLSRALELNDIMFFQQSYPDETHALARVRKHLYHSMDKFWTRCFHLNSSDYQYQSQSLTEQDSEYSE